MVEKCLAISLSVFFPSIGLFWPQVATDKSPKRCSHHLKDPSKEDRIMAGVSLLPLEILLSKRVQEMVLNGEEPPPQYISRDDAANANNEVSSQATLIPIIDLSRLSFSTSDTRKEDHDDDDELEKLRSALCSWGCFQAIGHGISSSLLDKIRQVAKDFFEQPMEVKKKHSKAVEEFEGYGADPVPAEGQSLDWSDRLFLDVYPDDCRKLKFWPDSPKHFRDVLEEYTVNMKMLTEYISKAMARSLSLQDNCFLDQFGERGTLQARFNYYSRCQRPDLILGLKAHADGSGYTVILQDDVEGLQVFKNEQWVTVPTIPHALLVLMGDQMEIMTNGVFKSPVHRVLTNPERERISLAMFYTPEPNKEIGPEQGLINEERPKSFKKVRDYADIHWEYYQQGLRALHTAQV